MTICLAPLIGTGAGDDPFRVDGAQQIIDLRPDARVRDGWALALLQDGATTPSGALVLTDAPSGPDAGVQRLSGSVRNQLSNRLGLTVSNATLGSIFAEVLLSGDDRALGTRTRWRPLRPSMRRLRHEIWLGGLLWAQPIIAGGANLTETWAGVSNGTAISGDHTWTKVSEGSGAGAWQILSERLFLDGSEAFNSARAETDLDTDDHIVTAEVEFTTGSSNQGGVCARFSASANTFYTCEASPRNGRAPWLEKIVAGTATDLGFTSNTVGAGIYTISLEVDGSSLAGNVTGFAERTATDTDITGHLRWGARARGRTTGEHAWDNYTAQDLGAGGITGSLSETQDNQTLAATGQLGYTGSLAETQDDQTLAASGTAGAIGSVAETQDNQTLAATGQLGHTGSVSEAQDDQTLAASGTVTAPGETTGSLAETQDDQTLAATGTAGAIGSVAETQDDQTLAATGQLGHTGSVSEAQDDQTLASSGTVSAGASGTLAETQDNQTLAASGTVTAPVVPSPGWWGLKATLDMRRAEFVQSQIDDEQRCPHDGELLLVSTSGVPFCRFDGPIPNRVID